MRDVYVIGAHTIKFGRYLDKSSKDLAADTVIPCLKEAGLDKKDIQALWFSNSGWGYAKGQDCIRGQVAMRPLGIESIPMTNVENACAGGSTAFHHAWLGVASGLYDITMAAGAEKMNHPNKYAVFTAFLGGLDIENIKNLALELSQYGMTEEDRIKMKEHLEKYAAGQNGNKTRPKKKKSGSERLRDYWNMFTVY